MRFSLSTLQLVVLLAAFLMLTWFRREPWGLEKVESRENGLRSVQTLSSPDGSREVWLRQLGWGASPVMLEIMAVTPEAEAHNWPMLASIYSKDPGYDAVFLDDDTLQLHVALYADHQQFHRTHTYHRRFPEWWWGHFYRPEVWASVVLFIILIVKAVRSRKPRSTERAVFAHQPADRRLPHRAGDGVVGPA